MPKTVTYSTTNSYDTLNTLSAKTKNVWLVCHGIGYLSKYFIQFFRHLDPDKNYIIAPQAPSKYYKDSKYKNVGACWLTKEHTSIETQNILNYLDAILTQEAISETLTFHVLGYSQGVSIASRWVARRKIKCSHLVLISGSLPHELKASDFNFLEETCKIIYVIGTNDPYFETTDPNTLMPSLQTVFPNIDLRTHEGGHEMQLQLVQDLF